MTFRIRSMVAIAAIAAAAFLPTIHAHAAFISINTEQGPSTGVLDTSTGLEWLKLSVTDELSISQVETAFAPGGQLQGYRYATFPEFHCGLLQSYFNKPCNEMGGYQTPGALVAMDSFFDLFGFIEEGTRFSYFDVDPPGSTLTKEGFVAAFFFYGGPPHYEYDYQKLPIGESRLNSPAFHWLVTQSEPQPVPEPATSLLFGLGAFALLARARMSYRGKQGKRGGGTKLFAAALRTSVN